MNKFVTVLTKSLILFLVTRFVALCYVVTLFWVLETEDVSVIKGFIKTIKNNNGKNEFK